MADENDVRTRSRQAARLQLAADEFRRAARRGGRPTDTPLATALDKLAAYILVDHRDHAALH